MLPNSFFFVGIINFKQPTKAYESSMRYTKVLRIWRNFDGQSMLDIIHQVKSYNVFYDHHHNNLPVTLSFENC